MFKRVDRAWGHYTEILRTKYFCLKILTFHPLAKLSVQRHFHRTELWWLIGTARFMWIPKGTWHTFEAGERSRIFEVQLGNDVREDDIERC